MTDPRSAPLPLRAAAALGGLQGAILVGYAVLELASLASDRLTMGTTTAAFFAAYGVGLLLCARGLLARRSWARSPLVLAQLIWLGVAWSFRGGETRWVAVALALLAVATLIGLLHPATTAAVVEPDGR